MTGEIYYIVKSKLHYYPPCVSQIRMLNDAGCKVNVLYGSCDADLVNELTSIGIKCIRLSDPRGLAPGKLDKIFNWAGFRLALSRYLKTIDKKESILWFGNAETLLPMKGLLSGYKYIITYLELLDTMPIRLKLLKRMSQKACAVVTCEETRSYLMQYWFKLDKLPFTMPNKPYFVSATKGAIPTTEAGKNIMRQVDGRKYVIYQGIFQNFEYLKVVAEVLKNEFPDYCFVMMGIDKYHSVDRIKAINNNTIYSEYIPAPKHLEITANADIGLLFYHPDSLNKAFCAPNKIFEYSYFGLPILGNAIPGLKNTIGAAGAGLCVDFDYNDVSCALHEMIDNYSQYSENAVKFYNSVDNYKTMKKIIATCDIKEPNLLNEE
jgi:glycosyltransferase involved in cell wall biosynthesis